MPIEFLSFWLRETISNISRNRLMSLVAITTTTVGLFILGTFFLTLANLRAAVDRETTKLDIVLFLKADLTPERRKAIYEGARIPQAQDVQFVSKEQALKEMQKKWPDIPMADFKNDNPLSDEIRIKLKKENLSEILAVQNYLATIDGVIKSRRDDEPVKNLLRISSFLAIAGVICLLVLGMGILLIIHNAIRLTIFARRREIRIMELVGATAWFIRIPFLLEGTLYGLAGATVAATILGVLWIAIARTSSELVRMLAPLSAGGFGATSIWWQCTAIMLLAGLLFGLIGSWASLSRSLGKAAHI
jgi:cell division transport system permease protein